MHKLYKKIIKHIKLDQIYIYQANNVHRIIASTQIFQFLVFRLDDQGIYVWQFLTKCYDTSIKVMNFRLLQPLAIVLNYLTNFNHMTARSFSYVIFNSNCAYDVVMKYKTVLDIQNVLEILNCVTHFTQIWNFEMYLNF